jgi:hypothetical protein
VLPKIHPPLLVSNGLIQKAIEIAWLFKMDAACAAVHLKPPVDKAYCVTLPLMYAGAVV